MKFITHSLLCCAALSSSLMAQPQDSGRSTPHAATSAIAATGAAERHTMTEGEVRKIDAGAKTITLRHGPIENLNMPGMTMVFQVRDRALLNTLEVGAKVQFRAEESGGQFIVTAIEAAP